MTENITVQTNFAQLVQYHEKLKEWAGRARNKIFNPLTKEVTAGIKLTFDTSLSINNREVSNTLKIVKDHNIIYCCGATIVVKNTQTNTQTIVSRKGFLRNVTALNAYYMESTNRIGLVIGESSSTEKGSIAIHLCQVGDESSWTTLTTSEIKGEVKKVHLRPEKKQVLALVKSPDEMQTIYLWNYKLDKKIGEQALAFSLEDVSFHPLINKKFLFFSNSHLRFWDHNSKTEEFLEGKPLVKPKIEAEGTFVGYQTRCNTYTHSHKWLIYQWMVKKGGCSLLVLSSNNIVRYFSDDFTKDPVDFRIDFASMTIKVISTTKNIAKDVDDTFGFENLGLQDKGEKEIYNQDDAKEPNFDYGLKENATPKEAKLPNKISCTAMASTADGFVLAATGGIICFFRFPEAARLREHKKSLFYNMQSYQIHGVKDGDRIGFISVGNGYRMVTFVLETSVETVSDVGRTTILPIERPGKWRR